MKRHCILYSAAILVVGGIAPPSFAQTSLNDRVGATVLVDPSSLGIPNNGVIAGAYHSTSDGGYYDWRAFFSQGNTPAGGLTDPPVSSNIPFGSQPSGVSLYDFYWLIVLGTDHNVWITGNSGWDSGWTPISPHPPVTFVSRPSLCVSSNGLAFYASVLGADGNVYYASGFHPSYNSISWGQWYSIGRPPVGANSAPAVASSGIFSCDFAVRGNDGAIWHYGIRLAGGTAWQSLGGVSASAPALCAFPSGRVDAWTIGGGDLKVWHNVASTGSNWSGWTDEVGAPPNNDTGAPTVLLNQPSGALGELLVFVPESSEADDYGPAYAERHWDGTHWSAWKQTTVDFYNSNLHW
jgi:hypothetical protein